MKAICVYTRAKCHHQNYKCSECPLTDLICDEIDESLDLSYEQGKADAIAEIHTELIGEIAMLNVTKMTEEDLYVFAVRIKEFTDNLFMKLVSK